MQRVGRMFAVAALFVVALLSPVVSPAAAATFGDASIAVPPIYVFGNSSTPVSVLHQNDGSVLVTGQALGPFGETVFAARFTANGSLDPTFGQRGVTLITPPRGITK